MGISRHVCGFSDLQLSKLVPAMVGRGWTTTPAIQLFIERRDIQLLSDEKPIAAKMGPQSPLLSQSERSLQRNAPERFEIAGIAVEIFEQRPHWRSPSRAVSGLDGFALNLYIDLTS